VPLSRIEREVGLGRLRAAAALDDGSLLPLDQQELDALRGAYAHLRPAMHAVLSAVELRVTASTDQALLDALTRVAGHRGRYVDEPVEVLPKSWRAWVLDEHGRVQRTRYELGLWFTARDALRAGRLFRPIGRRYADPAAFLLPADRWQCERRELAVTFDRPLGTDERLRQLEREQRAALQQLQAAVDARDGVRLAGDRLKVLPHDALPDDPAVARLQARVERLRPHVEITDVLADVDAWTAFTGQLSHAAGAKPRVRRLGEHLHAALLAWGMNLGPTRMAESCRLTYRQLAWATEWYLSDENLQAANSVLVDYLRQLELAAHWGAGTLSSSDGQRSAARGRAAAGDPAAREFGYRRGALTVLNGRRISTASTARRSSRSPNARPSTRSRRSCTPAWRSASTPPTRTAPPSTSSRSSTSSASDSSPACATPASYACTASARPPACPSTPSSAPAHAHSASASITTSCYAPPPRSKRGWVPASLLLMRLKNSSPQTPLAAALGEYGRIARTNFLLGYCADPELRSRITGQLNKGETLHALRRHLVIGSRAQLPADEDDHHRHALCLQLLVNAVLVWNTR
jgi:hypothetical protein